ncbi:HYR domain-containing protein [Solirubrobacter taibaiensis]|nr:HYR domain-containing protein [Solirubrobacter taibaiensis]
MSRRRLLLVTLVMGAVMPASAVAAPGVGHRVERIEVPGAAAGEQRKVDVHLWYPAQTAGEPKTVYTSALFGKPLPNNWEPLSWSVEAELAREGAPLSGGPYAPIVFSHGANNDPIDYAHMLEEIAAAGFVVIAPTHTNNTQDDVRRDYINALAGQRVFDCEDGLAHPTVPTLNANGFPNPPDCAKASVPNSMTDRVRDVDAVLDNVPAWFDGAVDATQAGVIGHSRGTVTALTVAGGSTVWGTQPDPRVKAIMGMAIGAVAINNNANLANIHVPTRLFAGRLDSNTAFANTEAAFNQIPATTDKAWAIVEKATHRSFDSTYCAQLQSAGAALDTDGDKIVSPAEAAATNRPLDKWNVPLIAASYPGLASGKASNYCSLATFTTPVNIEQLVAATRNAEYACSAAGCGWAPPQDGTTVCTVAGAAPPCTGLDTDEVKADMTEEAVAFFGPRLDIRAPEIHVADVTVNAAGPTGTTASYAVSATDDTDPSPSVTCTPPSGSVFAIGSTNVTCTATDARGNAAEKTFTVTVLGAGPQLANLVTAIVGESPLLRALLSGFDPQRPLQRAVACVSLRTFTTLARLLAPTRAAAWITDANRIRAVLAC